MHKGGLGMVPLSSSLSGLPGLLGQHLRSHRYEAFAALRDVPNDRVMSVVDALVAKATTVEEALVLCEACLASVEQGPLDTERTCLVKCAIDQQLEKWPERQEWTRAQRSRHAGLTAKVRLDLDAFDVHLVDRLPPTAVDTVLGVAVQQAARHHGWPGRLTQLTGLAEAWQARGGSQDLAMARSLLNCLGQSLNQLHQVPMDKTAREAMGLIESRLCEALLTQVKVSIGVTSLWSAVKRIEAMREARDKEGKAAAVDWTCQEDVLAVVHSGLRQSGLTFRWAGSMTLEAWASDAPTDEASLPGLRQQLAAVLHALAIADGMHLDAHHPSVDCLRHWLKERAGAWGPIELMRLSKGIFQGRHDAEAVEYEAGVLTRLMEWTLVCTAHKDRVLQLLTNPTLPEVDRSGLMECFAKVLSSPGTSLNNLGWIVLNYAEHVDLTDALAPIWEPTVPGDSLESGIDRAARIAHRLGTDPDRLHDLRFHTQDMTATTSKAWWFLLMFAQFCIDQRERAFSLIGHDSGHDVHLFLSDSRGLSIPSRRHCVNFFGDLWARAVANGVCHKRLSFYLLSRTQPLLTEPARALWDRMYEPFLKLFRSSVRQSLDASQQLKLLINNVIGMAVRAPYFPHVKGLIVSDPTRPESWTDEDFDRGMQSIEACVERECAGLKEYSDYLKKSQQSCVDGEPALVGIDKDTFALDIGTFWAELAAMRPAWLESVAVQYPWLPSVIAMANDAEALPREKNLEIAKRIRQAAKERNAKDLG